MAARSSLELMLDSIRQRDELPKDAPPALPNRPVKRGRLPKARRFVSVADLSEKAAPPALRRRLLSVPEEPVECPYSPSHNSEKRTFRNSIASPASSSIDQHGYSLKEKASVWCRLPDGNWGRGTVLSFSDEETSISLPEGRVLKQPMEDILPANPDILNEVDDLMLLSYLNEPSILHHLRSRWSSDKVYTKAGSVSIAVNPFKELPLHDKDETHIYAVTDDAYKEMMRDEISQSIIMSGKSGAGKTETAKIVMRYVADFGREIGIGHKIMQANLILEALGNARTSRNGNSSRFGKLVEMHFSVSGELCGAKIQTLLLETARVVRRATKERSYHVFYQLCAGAPKYIREKLHLKEASEYEYLKHSDCQIIDNVNDAKGFRLLMEAFNALKIPKDDQDMVFSLIAAILWLGNVSFSVINDENHVEVFPNEGLINAAKLLGCSVDSLICTLLRCRLHTGEDTMDRKLTFEQAVSARDALAKYIYVNLFEWMVDQVNKSLSPGQSHAGRTISILDLYGFETLQNNGFEQFCINYADERLQQHFNRYLFKLDQEECDADGVEGIMADFTDNTECLSLFEKRPLGLLSLLDQESTFPTATGLTFMNKLRDHLKDNSCFKSEGGSDFKVLHYAGEVSYDISGFLEKNRDPVHPDSVELLLSSSIAQPMLLASHPPHQSQMSLTYLRDSFGTDTRIQSVCMKFKVQLFTFMQHLDHTTPHFIHCIKPNEKRLPGLFENNTVLQQLKCCGLLEAVRVSREGYPTRLTHQEFATRYGFLLSEELSSRDQLGISVAVLQKFNIHPGMYRVGYSKLYFRTGQISLLEDIKTRMLRGIVSMQKHLRGIKARQKFMELKNATIVLQSFIRGENARKESASNLKRLKATKDFQSVLRWEMNTKQACDLSNGRPLLVDNISSKASDTTSGLEELQRRIFMVEKALQEKEEENLSLRRQLKQYEARWCQYEERMKSMEGTWQKQLVSLQTSLAEARSHLTANDLATLGKVNAMSPAPHIYDSEDTISIETRTPEATPPRISRFSTASRPLPRHSNGNGSIPHLLGEFQEKKKAFEDDVISLADVNTSNSRASGELRKLKRQFEAWKREYRVKLHETRMALQKDDQSKGRRWWEKLTGK